MPALAGSAENHLSNCAVCSAFGLSPFKASMFGGRPFMMSPQVAVVVVPVVEPVGQVGSTVGLQVVVAEQVGSTVGSQVVATVVQFGSIVGSQVVEALVVLAGVVVVHLQVGSVVGSQATVDVVVVHVQVGSSVGSQVVDVALVQVVVEAVSVQVHPGSVVGLQVVEVVVLVVAVFSVRQDSVIVTEERPFSTARPVLAWIEVPRLIVVVCWPLPHAAASASSVAATSLVALASVSIRLPTRLLGDVRVPCHTSSKRRANRLPPLHGSLPPFRRDACAALRTGVRDLSTTMRELRTGA